MSTASAAAAGAKSRSAASPRGRSPSASGPRANGLQSITRKASSTQGAQSRRVASSAIVSAAKIARSRALRGGARKPRHPSARPSSPTKEVSIPVPANPARPAGRISASGASAGPSCLQSGPGTGSRTTSQATATTLIR